MEPTKHYPAPVPDDQLDTVRVYVYARQSSARPDASEASPAAQVAACRALADSRSTGRVRWEVVGTFSDVGRSGWDPKVIRPQYEEMMRGVRAGKADVVIVNELSRLTRKGAHDALEIDQEFKAHGVRFVSVLEPYLDTSTPIGVAIFALIAALAKQDSDTKSGRVRGAKAEIAAVGGRHSASPPYGMRVVREQVGTVVASFLEPDEDNPQHVAAVEQMVELCLSGVADNAIAKQMEEQRVQPPGLSERRATERRMAAVKRRRLEDADKPIRWRASTVAAILNHPAIGGFASQRVKRGKRHVHEIQRNPVGKPLAPHRGIISGTAWLELYEARKRRVNPDRKPGGTATPQLLSGWGFFRCGICSGSMGQAVGKGGVGLYQCANPVGHGGLAVKRDQADSAVAYRVWARLLASDIEDPSDRKLIVAAAKRFAAQQDTEEIEAERREKEAHLAHVRQSIAELQADRKAGLYRGGQELETWRATMGQYRQYEDECMARLTELGNAKYRAVQIPDEWMEAGADPLGKDSPWDTWDVFRRREFLDLFLEGVEVGPGRGPDKKSVIPTEERLTLLWRGDSGSE